MAPSPLGLFRAYSLRPSLCTDYSPLATAVKLSVRAVQDVLCGPSTIYAQGER
jgi:hypothetical protein